MKTKILVLAMCATLFAACNSNKVNSETDKQTSASTDSLKQAIDVPYTVASNYFVNNTVENKDLTLTITSEEEFKKYTGMATTMNSKPTAIDFSQQYVIAVFGAETDKGTEITAKSLVQSNGTITLTYKVEEKAKQSFTIRPSLLLIVDKKYTGDVKFEKQ